MAQLSHLTTGKTIPLIIQTFVSKVISLLFNLENSAVATQLEKVSFHSNLKEGHGQKMLNYHTIMLISHASKLMLKILKARLQQYVNQELPDVQARFRIYIYKHIFV